MASRQPPKRKRGQQPKINPKRIQKLLESIASGQYFDVSARMAGVHPTTMRSWQHIGEAEMVRVAQLEMEPEVLLEDWLDQFTDDFKADNPMWVIDPPDIFDPEKWIYTLFAHRLEKAKAIAEASAVANIRAAARSGAWQADAWYLERTRWQKYGRKETISHEGTDGPAIKLAPTSVEGLMERVQALTGGAK